MAQFSDAALLSTIETGVNSDDGYKTQAPHVMTFTSATDKAGIVPYLRSLDPNLLPDEQAVRVDRPQSFLGLVPQTGIFR
jgi:hypothetical protein